MNIIYNNFPQTTTNASIVYIKEVKLNTPTHLKEIIDNLIEKLSNNKLSEHNYSNVIKDKIDAHIKKIILFSFFNKKDVHAVFKEVNYSLSLTEHKNVWLALSKSSFFKVSNEMIHLSSENAHQMAEVQIELSEKLEQNLNHLNISIDNEKLSPCSYLDLYLPNYTKCLKEPESYITSYLHEKELILLANILNQNKSFFNQNIKDKIEHYVATYSHDLAYVAIIKNQALYEFTKPIVLNSLLIKLEDNPDIYNHLPMSLSQFLKKDMFQIYNKLFSCEKEYSFEIIELMFIIELTNKNFDSCDFLLDKYPPLLKEQSIIRSLFDSHLKNESYATNLLNFKSKELDIKKMDINKYFNSNKNNNRELLEKHLDLFNENFPSFFILTNNENYYKVLELKQFSSFDINSCQNILSFIEKDKKILDKTLFEKLKIEESIQSVQSKKAKMKI